MSHQSIGILSFSWSKAYAIIQEITFTALTESNETEKASADSIG